MATADWTTCPICLEVCENPKSLPCLHGFCLKCLEQHYRYNCPGDEVPCPVCRKKFSIPLDGARGLQHHFFMQHLVDAMNVSYRKPAGQVPCDVCLGLEQSGGNSDMPPATMYCIDCGQALCENCSRPHRKWKGGAHQVRPLGAGLEQELIQLRPSFCEKHKDKPVELYCHDCNENICVLCSITKHEQHRTAEIPEAAESFKRQIDSEDQQVWARVDIVRRMKGEKERKRKEFLSELDNVKREIQATGNKANELLKKQVALQLSEVDAKKSEDQKNADTVEDHYQLALVTMESFHAYSRELLDKGRPSDVTQAASELHKRATELLDSDVTSVQYHTPHVTFTPADVNQWNLIGKVSVATGNQSGTYVICCVYAQLYCALYIVSQYLSLRIIWINNLVYENC